MALYSYGPYIVMAPRRFAAGMPCQKKAKKKCVGAPAIAASLWAGSSMAAPSADLFLTTLRRMPTANTEGWNESEGGGRKGLG